MKRRPKIIARYLVLVLAASGLAACSTNPSNAVSNKSDGQSNLSGEVAIGAVVPLTGSSAVIGKDQQRGIDLAVDKINASGGVLGKKFVVKTEDSASTSAGSVQAAQKLVKVNNVPVVVGEYISNNTVAIAKYLQSVNRISIQGGSSSPDLRNIGDWSYGAIGLDDLLGKYVAGKLYDAGYRRLSYLGPNNAFGSGIGRVAEVEFKRLGGQVGTDVLYTEGQTTYNSELARIKSSKPDVVLLATYVPDSQTITREIYQQSMDPRSFFGLYLSIITQDASPKAISGMQGADLAYVGKNGAWYLDAYKAKFKEDPVTPYSAYEFDSVMLAAEAINKAGKNNPTDIRNALNSLGSYEGASGPISFDKDRQRVFEDYALLKVNADGKSQVIPKVQGPES